MMGRVPHGEPCGHCRLRFGSHELAKYDDGRWFHHSTFKQCWTKFQLRKLQEKANARRSA